MLINDLKDALEKSNGLLKLQQKRNCNCNIENGECNLCSQIKENEKLIKFYETCIR